MTLPLEPVRPLSGALADEAVQRVAIHRSIADVGSLSRPTLVKSLEKGSSLLPGTEAQPVTPARRLALARHAVAGRMGRRNE